MFNASRARQPAFEATTPASLLRRLVSVPGKVVLTLNGAVGDCAWDNPSFHLFQRGATFRRLTQSEETYRSARASREMIQVARRITLTDRPDQIFSWTLGLDNRDLLPPFTPIGRAEDIAFGVMLGKCFDSAYAVHLPWTLHHDPPEARSFSAQSLRVGFNSWIPSCISAFDPGFAPTPDERLRRLGQYLQDIGRLPTTSFEDFIRFHLGQNMNSLIMTLEDRLQEIGQAPPRLWLEDVRGFIALTRRDALLPVEDLYALGRSPEPIQRLLIRFGEVVTCWPTMVATARRLRQQGQRLAQPI